MTSLTLIHQDSKGIITMLEHTKTIKYQIILDNKKRAGGRQRQLIIIKY